MARITNWVCSADAPLVAERITPSRLAKRSREPVSVTNRHSLMFSVVQKGTICRSRSFISECRPRLLRP